MIVKSLRSGRIYEVTEKIERSGEIVYKIIDPHWSSPQLIHENNITVVCSGEHDEFNNSELIIMAGFICERYDMLMEIVNDPNPKIRKDYKEGSRKAAEEIKALNEKLRPYYVKGQG